MFMCRFMVRFICIQKKRRLINKTSFWLHYLVLVFRRIKDGLNFINSFVKNFGNKLHIRSFFSHYFYSFSLIFINGFLIVLFNIYFLVDIILTGNFALYLYCTYIFHFFSRHWPLFAIFLTTFSHKKRDHIDMVSFAIVLFLFHNSSMYITTHFLFQFRCSRMFSAIFFISNIILIIFLPLVHQSTL